MNVMTIGFRSAFALTLLAGCFTKTSSGYACETDDQCSGGRTCGPSGFCVLPDDAGGDGSGSGSDAVDPCMGFTARHFNACMIPKPTGPMTLPGPGTYIFNTSDGSLLDLQNNPSTPPSLMVDNMRVVSVESFSLSAGAILRVKGTYPLVIASFSTIDVGGTIDAASTALERGAGSTETPSTFCAAHAPATEPETGGNGGGGGAGGSMQSAGGSGGQGANNSTQENGGTPGTAAGATPPLLAAGCNGQTGGVGRNAGQLGGVGGSGGGAVQLTAKTSISIASTGRLHASGSGGKGGTNDSGGAGGGGAGGMIGLEAPMLTIMPGAILAANGGGGAQGGGSNGTPGVGQDGQLSATQANGGTGGSGGQGGKGSVSPTAAPNGSPDGAGGGGGGGGAGYVTIKATTRTDTGATFSPPVPITIP